MRRVAAWFGMLLLVATGSAVDAYDPDSHQLITERAAAADVSSLNQVLVEQLRLTEGIRQELPGSIIRGQRTIRQLLGDGAKGEDAPAVRVPMIQDVGK